MTVSTTTLPDPAPLPGPHRPADGDLHGPHPRQVVATDPPAPRAPSGPGPSSTFDRFARSRRLASALDDQTQVDELLGPGSRGTILVAAGLAAAPTGGKDRLTEVQARLDATLGRTSWITWPTDERAVVLAAARATDGGQDRDERHARLLWDALGPVRTGDTRIGTAPARGSVAESRRQAETALWVNTVQHHRRGAVDPRTPHPAIVHWTGLGSWKLLAPALMDPRIADQLARELPASLCALLENNHDELLPTLRSYLDHGGDVRACAARLAVHRSTLYYRLNRLADLLGADLRSGATRFELMLGLCVLDARIANQTDAPGTTTAAGRCPAAS